MIGTFSNNTEVKKELNYQNGFVIEATEEEVIRLKNTGAKVYENRRYSYQMGGKSLVSAILALTLVILIRTQILSLVTLPMTFRGELSAFKRPKLSWWLIRQTYLFVFSTLGSTPITKISLPISSEENLSSRGTPAMRMTRGHGTHVASTVAASINDKGIIGVSNIIPVEELISNKEELS